MLRMLTVGAVLAAGALAQTSTGSITGTVADPSDAPVAGASVTLRNVVTTALREAATDERGVFQFASLAAGRYQLTVTASGFKKVEKTNLNLTAAETLPVGRILLVLGDVAESITVEAQGSVVQTTSAERAGVVTRDQFETLLSIGRDTLSMIGLMPGVVGEGIDANVQGNRNSTNNVSVEGMPLNNFGNNRGPTVSLSMDAVAEMKVLLANYQAEYGRGSGANIVLVPRGGARAFHGLFSYFKRHEQFNANNYFNNQVSTPRSRDRFNMFTYNIGGPVYIPGVFNKDRSKLFFFWLQEYWPSSVGTTGSVTVPTALERKGDFSQSLDLNNRAITVRDTSTGAAFPGGIVPASRLNASGVALLNVFPLPNFLDRGISRGTYNYIFQTNADVTPRRDTLRLDYNLRPQDQFAFNYAAANDIATGALGIATSFGANWPQISRKYFYLGRTYSGRYTHIFSPTLINEVNLGTGRRPQGEEVPAEELARLRMDKVGFVAGQLYPAGNPYSLIPNATFGGVSNAAALNEGGGGRFPFEQRVNFISATNNVTWIRGAHTIKAGVTYDFAANRTWFSVSKFGAYDFANNGTNPLNTGYAYSNAALGVFNTYRESTSAPIQHIWQQNLEWFVQDNWRVSPRLTLDYGMRFYWIIPLYDRDNKMSGFVPERFSEAREVQLIQPRLVSGARLGVHPVTGEVLPAALIGSIAAGTGDPFNGMLLTAKESSYPRSLVEDRGVQYGPRFGFAYDITGRAKTVISGGFGIYFNRQNLLDNFNDFGTQPPLVQTPSINYGTIDNLRSYAGIIFPQNPINGIDRYSKTPTVINHSLSLKRAIGFGTVLDLAYVGSLGRHLMQRRSINYIDAGANFLPANADPSRPGFALPSAFLRRMTGYEDVTIREGSSSSNYHSLQIQANRRFARGLQFGANWTWSKALTYVDGDATGVTPLVPWRAWYYGLAGFDRTHIVKVNWIWDVPKTPWRKGIPNQVLNNWQVSGIATFASGAPVSVTFTTATASDITGTPSQGARAVVTGNPALPRGERTFARNFQTEMFLPPQKGTFGTAAKTDFRGPGANRWNLALFKNILVREPVRLNLRCEMSNAFNHTQFTAWDTAARFDAQGKQINTRFGQAIAAGAPRVVQIALRLQF